MDRNIQYLLCGLLVFAVSCGSKTDQNEDSEGRDEMAEVMEPSLVGEEISYSNGNLDMKGYLAYNENATEKMPGILVVHEWWGQNEYARMRADKLAEMGYVALAIDMYGDGKTADHPDTAGEFSGEVFANMDEAKSRFEAAMETLRASERVDPDLIGAIGYCFGGAVVLTMANAGMDLEAVAAFHSGLQLPIAPDANVVETEMIMVFNGADDPFVPAEQTAAWRKAMDESGVKYSYTGFEGVVHSFTNPGADSTGAKFELPLAYNQQADEQSWQAMSNMFKEVFEKERHEDDDDDEGEHEDEDDHDEGHDENEEQ